MIVYALKKNNKYYDRITDQWDKEIINATLFRNRKDLKDVYVLNKSSKVVNIEITEV